MTKIADMHIHSFYSDGTMTPEEIVKDAVMKDIGVLAITDHNVLEGSKRLKQICESNNIQYITGVELDSLDHNNDVHILGYGMDLENEDFKKFVQKNRNLLDEVSIQLIKRLEKEYDNITMDDFLSFTYNRRKGGWEALHYMMEKGLTKTLVEGFTVYTKYDCNYDIVDFPSVKTVINHIHNAGGKAVLAHPGKVIKEKEIDSFRMEVMRLVDFGLDGIECYYPSHSDEMTNACLEICRRRNLLITVGSDCHGSFQNTEIGEMRIPMDQLILKDLC